MVREHPVRAVVSELEQHGQCDHLTLDYFSEDDVVTYVRQRFGAKPLPAGFTSVLHQRTNGNPLFFITVLDDLLRQGVIVEGQEAWCLSDGLDTLANRVPASLQRLIELAVEQLTPGEQEILEAASVAGSTFPVAVVAVSTGQTEEGIDASCATWSRQGRFVRDSGMETWPNGTVTSCYRFIHALYHEVLYARVSSGRRRRLHQRIGACKESAYEGQAATIAAELAVHFEQAQNLPRAVRYRQQAAENVIQRSAYAETLSHLSRGLELLRMLPVTPEYTRLELEMQTALAMVLMPIKGYGDPETEHVLARIRALSQQVDESPQLVSTLMVMRSFYIVRGEYRMALGVDDQIVRLGQRLHDDKVLAWCHGARGAMLLLLGELGAAQDHLEQAERLNVPQKRRDLASRYGRDTIVHSLSWGCWSTWLLGYPQQALRKSQRAIRRAKALGSVYCLALALSMSTILHQCRGEWRLTRERAETLMTLCQEEALSFFLAMARIRLGWALAMGGQAAPGVTQLRQGLVAVRATGSGLNRTYFLTILAEAYAINGQVEAGFQALEEGLQLVQTLEERFYEAELYRLKGELLLHADDGRMVELTPEGCFHKALDVARHQHAKSLELRAATSLARLWQQQHKRQDAYGMLASVYGWFTEGFETADLQAARTLLAELA
jgi:predicted ATPase